MRPDVPKRETIECPDCEALIERKGDHDPQCPLAEKDAQETREAIRHRAYHGRMDDHVEQRRLRSP